MSGASRRDVSKRRHVEARVEDGRLHIRVETVIDSVEAERELTLFRDKTTPSETPPLALVDARPLAKEGGDANPSRPRERRELKGG